MSVADLNSRDPRVHTANVGAEVPTGLRKAFINGQRQKCAWKL